MRLSSLPTIKFLISTYPNLTMNLGGVNFVVMRQGDIMLVSKRSIEECAG